MANVEYKFGEHVGFSGTVEECEAWIAAHETRDPIGVRNGDYTINMNEAEDAAYQCRRGVLEAINKSAQHGKDWLTLVYELWQEDVIPESVYLRYVKEDHAKTSGSG